MTILTIEKIDPNFLKGSNLSSRSFDWKNAKDAPFELRGVIKNDEFGFVRVPVEITDRLNENLAMLSRHTAGGRVRFATDAKAIAFRARPLNSGMMSHMPLTGSDGMDVYVNGKFVFCVRPVGTGREWYEGMFENHLGRIEVEVNLPLYNGISTLLIGTEGGSVYAAQKYDYDVPVVYYGSSITQGGCASRPGNSYQGHISRWLNSDHINLGFSGNAKGEDLMAEYIASLDMSVFVMDYDHNAPSVEHLLNTHERFFKIIRNAKPNLPVVFVSKPDFDKAPEESIRRRQIILDTYRNALKNGDKKVWFVDGETLFGEKDRDASTVDGCHPNDLGFYRMAKYIYPAVREALESV